MRLWDRAGGERTASLIGYAYSVPPTVIAPDGSALAVADASGVRLWDRATTSYTAAFAGHAGPVNSVAIAPGGTWLASTGDDHTVRVWEAVGTCTVAVVRVAGGLLSCAWTQSQDELWLAVGGTQGVYLFELLTRSPLGAACVGRCARLRSQAPCYLVSRLPVTAGVTGPGASRKACGACPAWSRRVVTV
ncbi:hypothetical protein GCM10010211_81540 [Streptomyces albospinus]|uniref:Uncharacterized protein n=1 Tax=Streptomyces albospinus TaxID=285515 RepID=A0ABQ2VNR5_9ACTN|nr:hypothetical protein GCM10010211_81540 [Streptomyces albospinus]